MEKPLIGFIGQGWIGKNYADNFVDRGYDVVRYDKREPYAENKDKIKDCDIVFIAVPTPTTPNGFDDSIVRDVVGLVGKGNTAVIKSTMYPGMTESIQKEYPDTFVMHSPEFLAEKTAQYDAAHPSRNIVGIPVDNEEYRKRAQHVLDVLPESPVSFIAGAKEAELIKYGSNVFLHTKVVYANLMYDLADSLDLDWEDIKKGISSDPRIGESHLNPIDNSGHTEKRGRGAGGHCFIKDFAAFREMYEEFVDDPQGLEAIKKLEEKNNKLLRDSEKDLDLLKEVYGN